VMPVTKIAVARPEPTVRWLTVREMTHGEV
jgi:hypothetical protein